MSTSKTLALWLTLALAGGCKKKDEDKTAAKTGEPTPTSTSAPGQPPTRPAPMRRAVVPITVDEVKAMIPTLDGGRVLKPVGKAERGERIETTICFDKATDLLPIADQLKGKLSGVGWPTVNVRQHPQITDRVGVNANKPPYVFYGSIQRGPYPECTKDKGQALVTLSVHKIETVPGAPGPIGPRLPGSPGLRPQIPIQPNQLPPPMTTNPGGATPTPAPTNPAPTSP